MKPASSFSYQNNPSALVAGVDEAGRGPLCGPVVAAAVILDPANPVAGLNDSKKLAEKKRTLLADQIKSRAISHSIAYASVEEIDELNILQATLLAMQRAVMALSAHPELVLIDGNRCPELATPTKSIIKGDSQVDAIAAASILAKVARDHEMQKLDSQWPEYGLARHKGYGTKYHLEALRKYGPSPIHRRSFKPVALLQEYTQECT